MEEFILDSIKFILKNNKFSFDSKMFSQVFGTAMGTKYALPYTCLTIGYKKIKPFTQELPKYFSHNFEYFLTCLNNLHPAIKYMFKEAKLIQSDHSQPYQVLHFLDI